MNYFKYYLILYVSISSKVAISNEIIIHAPFKETYSCVEHWDGQFRSLGDALGTDCIIQGWNDSDERQFIKPFKNNGYKNEDWYGFRKNVLSPCDCIVESIHVNPVTNNPGKMNPSRASSIIFKTKDGIYIVIAHVREININIGDEVQSGQNVAKVGNNGYSRNPHIHIGAWDSNSTPLQIKVDQSTITSKRITE